MHFNVIIPARYASSRLPGKPLEDIHGKPMIVHVVERSLASAAHRTIVATDHNTIATVCREAGAEVCMTRQQHQNGTERLVEVVNCLNLADDEIIVNVQGDEPLIKPTLISHLAEFLASSQSEAATMATRITLQHEVINPNVVKVVLDRDGNALYFSRAPIPWDRDTNHDRANGLRYPVLRHVGLYAYRAGFLRKYENWKQTQLECLESLEQLRILWYGGKIRVCVTDTESGFAIDTYDDLVHARQLSSECFRISDPR